jgi:hypothetical protein
LGGEILQEFPIFSNFETSNFSMGPIKFTIIKRLKSNNRFNYTPRYYKGKEGAEDGKHPTKFDAYSDTFNDNDFGSHWREARLSQRNRGNMGLNVTILIIVMLLIIVFLYIIDFDLSIFSQK